MRFMTEVQFKAQALAALEPGQFQTVPERVWRKLIHRDMNIEPGEECFVVATPTWQQFHHLILNSNDSPATKVSLYSVGKEALNQPGINKELLPSLDKNPGSIIILLAVGSSNPVFFTGAGFRISNEDASEIRKESRSF
jgi:hypothetical protein